MGIYPEDLADILALRDDPDALREYLGEYYGLDDSVIDSFMHGLEQSTFAQTVDPEDADTFIDDVYYAAENSEDESADTGGDTAGSEAGVRFPVNQAANQKAAVKVQRVVRLFG